MRVRDCLQSNTDSYPDSWHEANAHNVILA
jgi:hypothetical protein